MDVLITARHFDIAPGLRDHVDRQLRRLVRYDGRLARVEVTLLEERREKRVEARASIDGDVDLYAVGSARDFRSAADRMVDRLARQVKRRHGRRIDHQAPRLGRDIPPERVGPDDEESGRTG